MVAHSRYDTDDRDIDPVTGIFKNKLGFSTQESLDEAELALLDDTYEYFRSLLDRGEIVFDVTLLFALHEYFLSTLYDWAGKMRQVDISKPGIQFAAARFLGQSVQAFSTRLDALLPVKNEPAAITAAKLSEIHNELNILHPFRDGNGRTIRMFIDLLALGASYEPIDWSKDKDYMSACRAGVTNNQPMSDYILAGLHKEK